MFRYFVTVACLCAVGYGAYFTMSDIAVNIPGNKTKYPPSDHALFTLYASKNNGKGEEGSDEHLKYSINTTANRLLQVYATTGDVMFTKQIFGTNVSEINVMAYVEDSARMKDSTTIRVNISPESRLDCDSITQDICYWHSVTYKILENSKSNTIGSLSSPYLIEMCRGYKVNYALMNRQGGNYFGLLPPTDTNKLWEIRSLQPLDRDIVRHVEPFSRKSSESGEYRFLSLKCIVENPKGTIREVAKEISIKVLDQDDNIPVPQAESINIYLPSNLIRKGEVLEHKDLLFIDKDSPSSNQYDIKILGDFLKILEPNCNTYEDDRQNEIQTAIHCRFVFTRDTQIPESPYKVVLQINDTAFIQSRGNNVVSLPISIYYHSRQNFPQVLDLTIPSKLPLILYPSKEVEIFRTVAPLARVTQPKADKLRSSIKSFEILSDSSNGAFSVTPNEGVLFIHNTTLLWNASLVRITIEWKDNKTLQSDEIEIRVVSEPNLTCIGRGHLANEWDICSNYKSKKSCIKACGLSTGGCASVQKRKFSGLERCMWRGDQVPGDDMTHLYATCTPDVTTCPDGICDELEKLHRDICPQDCMDSVTFPLKLNRKTGRGFDIGFGVCYCTTSANCLCESVETKNKNKNRTHINAASLSAVSNSTSKTTEATILLQNDSVVITANVVKDFDYDDLTCGPGCILSISAIIAFTILSLLLTWFCCRKDGIIQAVQEKYATDSTDISVPLSDYTDREAQSDTLHFNFEISSTLTSRLSKIEPDPKWEFPRNQLVVEQTLGEGEFGKVLKARALNIAGQPGYTTVAVKTLKADAGDRELADLLSEYQLLKEVAHPNIIRLLGASTQVGGPIYLIIEFAENGSLRNYLRRSRHVQSDTLPLVKTPKIQLSSELYDEPKTCEITPKDILSFAWQIANGMSYLSDIKLVHRDLAARNVLVAEGKICKISDFGLTRDVYEDDAYFKRSKGRVPVKWMAPESLSDHVYTNKSDVWGYGVLLWELITLGSSPYPGIAVQSLYHLLKSGYRMERPENCSVVLYKVMRGCWNADAEKRPTFAELSAQIEKMLGDEVQYLDLTGNAINNRGYFCDNLEDEEDCEELSSGKLNTDAVNYLSKTKDYEKCGDAVKIAALDEEIGLLEVYQGTLQKSEGYETPVKIQNKIETVTTPLNEFPQYGYTDMSASKKSNKVLAE